MPYDTENTEDVNPQLDFRLEFNEGDPILWFVVLEKNMLTRGINSQGSKKSVLISNLPIKVQKVCRTLICRENPGDTPYKDLKMKVIKHFGPKDIDILTKVDSLQLGDGKPSELARELLKTLQPCPLP